MYTNYRAIDTTTGEIISESAEFSALREQGRQHAVATQHIVAFEMDCETHHWTSCDEEGFCYLCQEQGMNEMQIHAKSRAWSFKVGTLTFHFRWLAFWVLGTIKGIPFGFGFGTGDDPRVSND